MVSLEAQKFFILMKSNLSIFCFVAYAFDVTSKKPLLNPRSQRFTPLFAFRGFIILVLTFRFTIHFELIFIYDVKWWVQVHFVIVENTAVSPLNYLCTLIENH